MSKLLTVLEDLYDAERLLASGEYFDDPVATAQAHDLVQGAILDLEIATEFDTPDTGQTATVEVAGMSS